MKNILKFFLVILFIGCITSCSSEQQPVTEEINNSKAIVSEITHVTNFEGTGVDFTLTPEIGKKSNNDEYVYKLETVYPSSKESIQTNLIQKFNEDGSYTITHSDGSYTLATLYYNVDKQLINIEFDGKQTKSLASWYGCVNRRYQELKRMIDGDIGNEFACMIMIFGCQVLSAMSAVEHC
ncbi:hypothetical protein FACS1894169_08480 [Bacteroidia bacterium]|nr:hypothetical protein FACS1894169_08480 [Bacteroidia bacterium]